LEEATVMATVRELMTPGAVCVGVNENLVDAAAKMRDLDVGSLPICGADNKLAGMLTDRDIVVRCIAEGGDPATTLAIDLAQGKPVTIGADESAEDALALMARHQIRRLPVIDGHQLVGMLAQADLARALPDETGEAVERISRETTAAAPGGLVRLEDTTLMLEDPADDVRGLKVVDSNGDDVGRVDGLTIDETERRVRFLEVGSGGFLGLGQKRQLIPVEAITRVEPDTVHVGRERNYIAGAPVYDPSVVTQPQFYEDLYGYWEYPPFWSARSMYPTWRR
jgi:CBS domain-containing protein/sporulation protein YlmC with PRC-barrel domain